MRITVRIFLQGVALAALVVVMLILVFLFWEQITEAFAAIERSIPGAIRESLSILTGPGFFTA